MTHFFRFGTLVIPFKITDKSQVAYLSSFLSFLMIFDRPLKTFPCNMCGHTVDHTPAILSLRLLAAEKSSLTFVFVKFLKSSWHLHLSNYIQLKSPSHLCLSDIYVTYIYVQYMLRKYGICLCFSKIFKSNYWTWLGYWLNSRNFWLLKINSKHLQQKSSWHLYLSK